MRELIGCRGDQGVSCGLDSRIVRGGDSGEGRWEMIGRIGASRAPEKPTP